MCIAAVMVARKAAVTAYTHFGFMVWWAALSCWTSRPYNPITVMPMMNWRKRNADMIIEPILEGFGAGAGAGSGGGYWAVVPGVTPGGYSAIG